MSQVNINKFSYSQQRKTVDCQDLPEVPYSLVGDGEYEVPRSNRKAKEQARRLRLIRERIHNIRSQYRFARVLGVEYPRYNNWERGVQPIPADMASRIKAVTPGIDLDYLLEGEESGLTVDILKKLRANDSSP